MGSLGTEVTVLTLTVVPQITIKTNRFCLLPSSEGTRGTLLCWGKCPKRKRLVGNWKFLRTDYQPPTLVTGCHEMKCDRYQRIVGVARCVAHQFEMSRILACSRREGLSWWMMYHCNLAWGFHSSECKLPSVPSAIVLEVAETVL